MKACRLCFVALLTFLFCLFVLSNIIILFLCTLLYTIVRYSTLSVTIGTHPRHSIKSEVTIIAKLVRYVWKVNNCGVNVY